MILKICLVVVLAAVVGLVVFQMIDPNQQATTTTLVDDPNKITIEITGEVLKEGSYVFSEEKVTMEDLISAAGGVNTNADDRCYYLEAELEDNGSYYIPPKYDNSNVCSEDPIAKVNINEADVETLMTVSGFGETISSAIVEYREANGDFYTLEGLKNVSGIGNAKYNVCKNYVMLHD